MTAQAIAVDGPKRGELIALESAYQPSYVVRIPVPTALDNLVNGTTNIQDAPLEPAFKEVVYYITRLKLFGFWLLVASIREPPRNIDLFEALASKMAKDIVLD